ncbi:MAG: hypothetical protein E3J45_02735 [Candidatus Zixiibacteriota bacterium]|nr:MAG: hypothetical protein E3J45_02735 [candidate division Zixibacteria bacterium]
MMMKQIICAVALLFCFAGTAHAGFSDGVVPVLKESLMEIIGLVSLTVLAWLSKKFLVPTLKSNTNKNVAEHLLIIADDVTDYLSMKYPDKPWLEWLDVAVDEIAKITGVSDETARRAAQAAMRRKASPNMKKPLDEKFSKKQ